MDANASVRSRDAVAPSKEEIGGEARADDYVAVVGGEIRGDEATSGVGAEESAPIGGGGSDSGVEGCGGGRAFSAGRSCASSASVASCGSEASDAAAERPAERRRRVAVAEPPPVARRPTAGRAPTLATRERARSREKPPGEKPRTLAPKPAVPPRRPRPPPAAPGSLPALQRESPAYKAKPTKTSAARCRTPGTPPEEAKKPFPGRSPFHSATTLSRTSDSSARSNSVAFDKYATLPRRRREPLGESRERAASASRKAEDRDSPTMRSLPPCPRSRPGKTKIYLETSVQTALLGRDVESALAGIGIREIRVDSTCTERSNKGVQADGRNIEIEKLEAKVRQLTETNAKLQKICDAQKQKIVEGETLLEEERSQKVSAQVELQGNTQRVLAMLGKETPDECGSDSLMVLESQLQTSANIVIRQQEEVNKLHVACRNLKSELDRATAEQQRLERQLVESECENVELQEFLTTEKATLQDAMRDLEEENALKRAELSKLRAECRHLVRISEQRRQETLALQARLKKWQGAVCGAGPFAVADGAVPVLENLIKRLQSLLDTLVVSYKISKEDLEEVVYHNEAYSCTGSSGGNSPEATTDNKTPCDAPPVPSTKSSGGSSLLSAFMSAIRSATGVMTSSQAVNDTREDDPKLSDDENSAELLDSETEPCIMMENVLEDVTMPDTYSQNLVSSGLSLMTSSISQVLPMSPSATRVGDSRNRIIPALGLNRQLGYYNKDDSCNSLQNFANFSGDELSPVNRENTTISDTEGREDTCEYSEQESLQNLSQAILNRQQSEAECSLSEDLLSKDNDDLCYKDYVVDKVVLVDNLITKLLKVLRIIQFESEATVQQMNSIKEKLSIVDKNVAEAVSSKLQELEKCNDRVLQYQATIEDLNNKLKKTEKTEKFAPHTDEASEPKQSARPPNVWSLREHLHLQYEAIDKALQVFHSVQPIVSDCPALASLQAELETLCFQTACEAIVPAPYQPNSPTSPLPRLSDCNANAPRVIDSTA